MVTPFKWGHKWRVLTSHTNFVLSILYTKTCAAVNVSWNLTSVGVLCPRKKFP